MKYHNGYNANLMLDDFVPEPPQMRFYLRPIDAAERDICSTLGIEVKTKTIKRGYKFRLTDLAPEQLDMLPQFFGNERFAWNKMLAEQNARMERGERVMSHFDMNKFLTDLKKEHPFLANSPSQALQARAGKLRKSFDACFDKSNPAAAPKFKKKFKAKKSFSVPQGVSLVGTDSITVPKLGTLYFINGGKNKARQKTFRKIEGSINSITLSQDGSGFWISIQTEMEVEDVVHASKSQAGLDVGKVRYASLSDGSYYLPLCALEKKLDRLAFLQQQMARQVKFSNNWTYTKEKVTKLHRKIANMRKDFLNKLSTHLCNSHAVIYVEDLKIKNMMASASGTVEAPGKNVARKSGLNRTIGDQAWGTFVRMLMYKQEWRGGLVIEVNPAHTSQRCPKCGFTHKDNRESQSRFGCINPECNYTANADYVAAINIKVKGQTAPVNLEVLLGFLNPAESGTCWREPVRISVLQGREYVNVTNHTEYSKIVRE